MERIDGRIIHDVYLDRVVFRETFTGDGSTVTFTLDGTIGNATFKVGAWGISRVLTTLPAHITKTNKKPVYDSLVPLTRNRIAVSSINSTTGVVTLDYAPRDTVEFYVWYWYDLLPHHLLDDYYREDFVAHMEEEATAYGVDIAVDTTNFAGIFTSADNTVQKALDTADDHAHGGIYYTETEINTWRNSVSQTEMGYLDGVTGDIQTQLNVNTSKVTESTTVTAPLALTTYDISIPAATNAAAGHATAAHITALEANSAKVTCNFTNVQTALAAASGAVAFNSQNLTGVGTIGCGAITTSGLLEANAGIQLDGDIKTDRWENYAGNIYLGIGVCGAGNASGAVADTAIGYQALYAITSGDYNVAIGYRAGYSLTEATNNLCLGASSGHNNVLGISNVCVGTSSGYGVATFSYQYCMFLGYAAGYKNKGNDNVAIGANCLAFNETGSKNVCIGMQAAYGVTGNSHSNNTFIGYKSGFAILTGGNNVCIGYQAGNVLTTGSGNIIIGYDLDPSANNATNEINIGGVYKGDTSTTVPSFGTYTALNGETLAGYITIKDLAGNDRKVAVVA